MSQEKIIKQLYLLKNEYLKTSYLYMKYKHTNEKPNQEEITKQNKKMAKVARNLYNYLTEVGKEPIFEEYLIKNRKASPREDLFYEHIHPVQDLMKFVRKLYELDEKQEIKAEDMMRQGCIFQIFAKNKLKEEINNYSKKESRLSKSKIDMMEIF